MITVRHDHVPIAMHLLLPDITDELVEATSWEELPSGGRRKLFHPEMEIGDFYWNLTTLPYLADRYPEQRELVVCLPTPGGKCATGWPVTHPNHNGYQWVWDGNVEKPTLSPSIHWIGVFHGWIAGGILSEA